MEKIRLGKTELMVSRVALGGIPLMRVPRAEAAALVRESIDLGINFIDTANAYADSEEKIGEAIKGMKRDELVIASKSLAGDKETFNAHLDLSLERLGLEYIDIYHVHNVSSEKQFDAVFGPGGAFEALQEAVEAGKVRFPAVSSHSLPLAARIMKSGKFDVAQIPFNFIDNEAEKVIIPLAKELDMGFIAMKPMGGGLLNDAGLSFRYLMQYGDIVPDPGIEKVEEIREIVGIVKKAAPFSEQDRKEVERLRIEFGASWCHRCDYCDPCPQGIPISKVLPIKSMEKRFTPEFARSMFGPGVEKAKTCADCGVCTSRCPYNLEIPRLLKNSIEFWDNLMKKW